MRDSCFSLSLCSQINYAKKNIAAVFRGGLDDVGSLFNQHVIYTLTILLIDRLPHAMMAYQILGSGGSPKRGLNQRDSCSGIRCPDRHPKPVEPVFLSPGMAEILRAPTPGPVGRSGGRKGMALNSTVESCK